MMLVDKESGKSFVQMEETSHKNKEYASKGVADTALGLSIAGLSGWLLNSGLFNNNCNLFGNNKCCGNGSLAMDAIIANNAMNTQYNERKECADYITLLNGMWKRSFDQQKERFNDRQVINSELFAIDAKHNKDSFDLYKYSRDSRDELSAEVGALRTEVAVMKAVRPYQDALIKCDIERASEQADFNLFRRTCRMISGQVILPITPEVTGFGSFNPCCHSNKKEK